MDVTLAAQLLVLVYLAVRDVRSGTTAANKVLIDTLRDTISAQQDRITRLEAELKEAQDHTKRLAERLLVLERESFTRAVTARKGNGHAD